jgi:F0F1-type ATP synthase membrane subunit b/b'
MDPWEIQRTLLAFALAGGALRGERMLFAPEGDASGGGGGGSGDGGNTQQGPPADAPKYSDKQLNDFLAKEKASVEKKIRAEAEQRTKDLETQLAEKTREAELAGKSADEKAKLIADSDAKKRKEESERTAKEAAEYKARAEKAESSLRHRIVSSAAQSALIEAKVLPAMAGDALDLFVLKSTVELEDDGVTVKSVTVDGTYHKTMQEAAAAFLKTRPGFMPAPAGGSGTPRSGGGFVAGKFHELDPSEAMRLHRENEARGAR